MARISENKLAQRVCELEGGQVKLSMAQVKEVIKHTLDVLAQDHSGSEVLALVEKHAE